MALNRLLQWGALRRENELQRAEILRLSEDNLRLASTEDRYRIENELQQAEIERLSIKHKQLEQRYGRLQKMAEKLGVMDLLRVQRLVESERGRLEQIRSSCDVKRIELESIEIQLQDLRSQILVLADLRDKGIITQEEFSRQKSRLLGSSVSDAGRV